MNTCAQWMRKGQMENVENVQRNIYLIHRTPGLFGWLTAGMPSSAVLMDTATSRKINIFYFVIRTPNNGNYFRQNVLVNTF